MAIGTAPSSEPGLEKRSIWQTWTDMSGDMTRLREDVTLADAFFDSVRRGMQRRQAMQMAPILAATNGDAPCEGSEAETETELQSLLGTGHDITSELHRLLGGVCTSGDGEEQRREPGIVQRLEWLSKNGKISALQSRLKVVLNEVCNFQVPSYCNELVFSKTQVTVPRAPPSLRSLVPRSLPRS